MSDRAYRARLRLSRKLKGYTRRPFGRWLNPFEDPSNRPLILHRCYHKVGTVWFERVLGDMAAEYGMSFGSCITRKHIREYESTHRKDVFLDFGSHVHLARLPSYRGSHMFRDPRDLVVSGYFYHLWTDEKWARTPKHEYGGLSYQEHLRALDKESGILAEMEKGSGWIRKMAAWNFDDPRIIDIRYEDIIESGDLWFRKIFSHYGFSSVAVDRCCKIAAKYSLTAMRKKGGVGERSHARSGKANQWKEHFSEVHVEEFKRRFPNVLQRLGYEQDDSWTV